MTYAHGPRELGDRNRSNALYQLRGNGVLGIDQPITQGHLTFARRLAIAWPPYFTPAQRNFNGLINEFVVRLGALAECRAINKRFERRPRLTPCLLHMIEGIVTEIATADPGLDLPVARVERQETGLHQALLLPQLFDEIRFGQQKQGDWKYSFDYNEMVRHDPRTINTGVTGTGSNALSVTRLATPGSGDDLNLDLKRKLRDARAENELRQREYIDLLERRGQ